VQQALCLTQRIHHGLLLLWRLLLVLLLLLLDLQG
jgi:hypothetical protein